MLRKLAGCVVVLAMLGAAPAAEARSVTIAAAGDIATSGPGDSLTAALIKVLDPDRVLTLGDNAYPDGTLRQFKEHYHPTWGAFKGKTHPALGNHDYHTEGAAGYFTYFGSRAPARNYTYVLGSWRVVSLDSARKRDATRAFLKRTLRSDSHRCELVYFHHPRWSSGEHGSDPSIDGIWDTAVAHGVDVVLNGHDHNYERFARLGKRGRFRPDGTRQIVVGTGGAPLRDLDAPLRGSLERIKRWGVLRMTLRRASYRWSFRGVLNAKLDAGKTRCHR